MKLLSSSILLAAFLAVSARAQNSATNAALSTPATNTPAATNTAPVRIAAGEAKEHVGAQALVTGQVAEVNRGEKIVRLNFDKPFPRQPFTAVVFATQTNQFGDLDGLKDKTVEVRGKITEFRGRPQIILNSSNQLKVVESPAPAAKP